MFDNDPLLQPDLRLFPKPVCFISVPLAGRRAGRREREAAQADADHKRQGRGLRARILQAAVGIMRKGLCGGLSRGLCVSRRAPPTMLSVGLCSSLPPQMLL